MRKEDAQLKMRREIGADKNAQLIMRMTRHASAESK
jgi:hypothetical protein